MKKQLGIAAVSLVGLAAGAGAGFVLTGGSGGAAAQESPTTTAESPTTTAPAGTPAPKDAEPDKRLQDVLAPLVADGTITQAQADAVIKALEAARPGPGERGHHSGFRAAFGLDAAAKAIGISSDDLRTALQSGQTIADVAKAHGVDPTAVVDAMVAEVKAHEQQEVTSGSATQAEADAKVAAAKDRITAIVNGQMPPFAGRDHDREGGSTPTTTPTTQTN